MVVVLVVLARAATPAKVAGAMFTRNGRAANIEPDSTGLEFSETYSVEAADNCASGLAPEIQAKRTESQNV